MSSSTPSPHLKVLTNFCSEWFVGDVKCSCVTADQHSPSNLAAVCPQARSRGLRVEHYIRPPVTVTLELSFPITVWCVLLSLDLPQEAEGRVELVGSVGGSGGECRLCAGPLEGTSAAVLAARCKRVHGTPAVGSKLSEWLVHRSYAGKDLQRQECVESALRDVHAARHLRQLQVKITRWTGPKPVSIKWLEVWGVLSTICSKEDKDRFLEKFHASMVSQMSPSLPPRIFQDKEGLIEGTSSAHATQELKIVTPSVVEASGVSPSSIAMTEITSSCPRSPQLHANIPEQLLDALTFEMMVLPMLLPSGHYVDRSTLYKLAHADALYGRPPTDPFTGTCMHTCALIDAMLACRSCFHGIMPARVQCPPQV